MKKVALVLLFFYLRFISHAQLAVFTSDYIALTVPQHYDGSIWYINDSIKQEIKLVRDLRNDSSLLKSFANLVSNVTVYEETANGGLTVIGVGISGKNKKYMVIYDFSQTQTLTYDLDKDRPNSVLVGISVRMIARVQTKSANINLSSPFSLTADASKITGTLEVRVNGIGSPKINGLIPTTTDLSTSSISVALQSVATIKSHIYDKETIITPQYLAYNIEDKTVKAIKELMKK